MEIGEIEPIVLYDNECSSCSAFARAVDAASRRRLSFVGHYTSLGAELRNAIGDGAGDMFWVVDRGYAHGGRAGLARLAMRMLRGRRARRRVPMGGATCSDSCGGPRAVVFRSCSALTRSRVVRIGQHGLNTDTSGGHA